MAAGKLGWNYDDFVFFYEALTLPNGNPARLEGFQRLILRFIFAGYVELLVLIPKGQAKTTLMAALAVYHLVITPNANCYIGAATKTQAGEMFRFACHFVDSTPELLAILRTVKSTKEIFSRRDQGFLRVLASDDSKQGGKAQGYNPTLALLDELHAHENDNLYVDMRSGLFKSNGLLIVITTAGWDTEGVLGMLRQGFLDAFQTGGSVEDSLIADADGGYYRDVERGRLTVAYARNTTRVDDRTSHTLGTPRKGSAMLEWALRPEGHPLGADNPDDMAVVKLANVASWVTIDSLQDALDAPGITTWIFRRYRCNLWTLAFDSWLPASAWLDLKHAEVPVLVAQSWTGEPEADLAQHVLSLFPANTTIAGAIDMARYRDCAAITVIGEGPDGLRVPRTIIWRSGGQDNPVEYEPTMLVIRLLHVLYNLKAFGYDQKYYDWSAAILLREGIRMELFPQSNERMCPAAADLRYGIVTAKHFAHDGDKIAAAHIMSAVAVDVGDGQFKLVKTKETGPPIDGCISLAMADTLYAIPEVRPWAMFS